MKISRNACKYCFVLFSIDYENFKIRTVLLTYLDVQSYGVVYRYTYTCALIDTLYVFLHKF